ncbi:MAG: DUF1292 domain-containing protein [Erysipelotrichaceae bacterium]|nr:DUF1292 domain-containing protein [Erysipelotrichaceae bacterium]
MDNMLDEGIITIEDADGNSKDFEVLFTVKDDNSDKNYVLYFDPEGEEGEVFTSVFHEDGTLEDVETQEEWDFIEEVFNAYMAEEE